MIAPAYAIPKPKRRANIELASYVRAEFRDHECHWFTCGNGQRRAGERPPAPKLPLLGVLSRRTRRGEPVATSKVVPCAVALVKSCENDQSRSAPNK